MTLPPYIILHKAVGETPLACLEAYRTTHPELQGIPLAYAGRLDPMASGKLLILVGDTCKDQTNYHNLDKAYEFSVLCGIGSDTHDVLGRLTTDCHPPMPDIDTISKTLHSFIGQVTLPYPHFSSKTVHGKPLHTWALEGRLEEITIPTKTSTIYTLEIKRYADKSRHDVVSEALAKIDTIPPVTEESKALGNDFRRVEIRADWKAVATNPDLPDSYRIITFSCIASSGTYMRTLAHLIAQNLGTKGLAWHIHRSNIGTYDLENATWLNTF